MLIEQGKSMDKKIGVLSDALAKLNDEKEKEKEKEKKIKMVVSH